MNNIFESNSHCPDFNTHVEHKMHKARRDAHNTTSIEQSSATNKASKASLLLHSSSSSSSSSSTLVSSSELSYKTATSPPPQQQQREEQQSEINNCVYKLICTQCRRPFTFSFQLKHEQKGMEHGNNKVYENCTQVNNHDSGSMTNKQTSYHSEQAAMYPEMELSKEDMVHTTEKKTVQDWYNEIATEMHKLYTSASVEMENSECKNTKAESKQSDMTNEDMIAESRRMVESLRYKVETSKMSSSASSEELEEINNNSGVNLSVTSHEEEEEIPQILYSVEQVMSYLVTHYGLKQPLSTECWNEQNLQSMMTSATSHIDKLENLVRLLPQWNSDEMRCMCNSIKIMPEELCKKEEMHKGQTSFAKNIRNSTFSLDTIANNLFNSAEGVYLLSMSDDYNNHHCCCLLEQNMEPEIYNTQSKKEKNNLVENTCTVPLTCNGPNVLVLSSTYNKQQSLLKEVEDAERAAITAERLNNELQQKLITLQDELANRHELHHEWDDMNRYRAMCKVSDKYKYMDEAARRQNNIQVSVGNLHDVRTLPLYVLAFPIDVRGEIATIDGLRLGFVGSTEKMQNEEELYAFLNEHQENDKLEENKSEEQLEEEQEIVDRARLDVHETNQGKLELLCKGKHGEMYHQFMSDWKLQKMQSSRMFGKLADKAPIGEVNTACGLLCELLALLAQHHVYSFSHAILHPHGAQSTISLLKQFSSNTQTTLSETHGVNVIGCVDFYISERFFAWRTFPSACEAMADCVHELCQVVENKLAHARNEILLAQDSDSLNQHDNKGELPESALTHTSTSIVPSLQSSNNSHHNNVQDAITTREKDMTKLMEQETIETHLLSFPPIAPYRITKGAIDGMCIRHGSVSEAAWSLAMKKLLTNVQWCVAASVLLEQYLLEN